MLRLALAGAKLNKLFHGFPPLDWLRFGGAFFLAFLLHILYPRLYEHNILEKIVDITKWKSVLVPIEVYTQIKAIAKAEGRTISGQLRIVWETYKETRIDTFKNK